MPNRAGDLREQGSLLESVTQFGGEGELEIIGIEEVIGRGGAPPVGAQTEASAGSDEMDRGMVGEISGLGICRTLHS